MDKGVLQDRLAELTHEQLEQALYDTLIAFYYTVEQEWGCGESCIEWCVLYLDGKR